MILTDLVDNLDQHSLYETCKTKLHSTFVQYNPPPTKKGVVVQTTKPLWYHMEVYFDQDSVDQGDFFFGGEYGTTESAKWITLLRSDMPTLRLRSLERINSEPKWPEAGYYWNGDEWFQVCYGNSQSYKAGLSMKAVQVISSAGDNVNHQYAPRLLDCCNRPVYPTIDDAVKRLDTGNYTVVPLSTTLTVAPHPYVEGPVLHWETHPVGLIKGKRVLLTKSSEPLMEYLEHMEIDYAQSV